MATPRKTWTDEQAETAQGLMEAFCGAGEVCAVTGTDEANLDRVCMSAFGCGFDEASERFACVGRARLRRALMSSALDGNQRALDMLAREQLGIDPVASRRAANKPAPEQKLEL